MNASSAGAVDVGTPGAALAPLRTGPWTSSHIARWCAAQQNWDKIHYDVVYATQVAKLPGTLINGALKQHLIVRFLEQGLPGAWVWRLDYRFGAMDRVGESLVVHGSVSDVRVVDDRTFVRIDFAIRNAGQDADTTTGTAVCIRDAADASGRFEDDGLQAPRRWDLDRSVRAPDPDVPPHVNARLGQCLERVESDYAIDASRLRLFADAVGGLHPVHFDPGCAAARAAGAVLAPPLFPLHALELRPGSRPLSAEPAAMGREGVAEVGRDMAGHFGVELGWNGGNSVQIHSLARAGERVVADSVLAGASVRHGRATGRLLFFETLNTYRTVTGRRLLTERQVTICRA